MNKHIEEMAEDLWRNTLIHSDELCEEVAEYLYTAGYRKQSEGKWKLGKSGCMYFCSSCGYAAHPREEEEWNFCPNCGARMKGDTNDA